MKELTIHGGHKVFLDDEDYDKVIEHPWLLKSGYPFNWYKGYMQNFIMGVDSGVDHIDRNKLNMQKSNLRLATYSQQNANRSKMQTRKTTSRYKGVYWDRGKWKAQITLDYKTKHLGRFSDEWEAAEAYNKAAIERFGEFAHLNTKEQ
jgi:hypothetical protein